MSEKLITIQDATLHQVLQEEVTYYVSYRFVPKERPATATYAGSSAVAFPLVLGGVHEYDNAKHTLTIPESVVKAVERSIATAFGYEHVVLYTKER